DVQVQTQRPVAQVIQVVVDARLHLLDGFGLAPQAVDLRPSGDAGLDLVALHVALDELAVHLVARDRVGARADYAHAALQYVDELRQLVERGAAHEGAERGDARIDAADLVDLLAVLSDAQGAELVDDDLFAVDAV